MVIKPAGRLSEVKELRRCKYRLVAVSRSLLHAPVEVVVLSWEAFRRIEHAIRFPATGRRSTAERGRHPVGQAANRPWTHQGHGIEGNALLKTAGRYW